MTENKDASAKTSEVGAVVSHVLGTNASSGNVSRKVFFPSFHPSVCAEYADIRKAWNTDTRSQSPREKPGHLEGSTPSDLRVVARSMPPGEPNSAAERKLTKSQEIDAATATTVETQKNFDQSLDGQQINENMDKKYCDTTKMKGSAPLAKNEDIPVPDPVEVVRESSPKPPIMISLDNEDGETKIVDIDADDIVPVTPTEEEPEEQENKENVGETPDEGPPPEHRLTATNKSRSSEAIVASLKENAEQRQKDFEKLLDEHAILVQEITRASSSDNLTQENTRE